MGNHAMTPPRRPVFGLTVLVLILLPSFNLKAQEPWSLDQHYNKSEHRIPMRDGVQLYTVVYSPKDQSRNYPIMMSRTCYSCRPYGKDRFPGRIGPSETMEREGYIFVKQVVRGRWMSGGLFDNMRPHVPGDSDIDESSDTYDTIEWLLAELKGHNGKVGMWGISYPGFYTAAALPEAHPALTASSPQAPISDFFFDDFHHHGAYLLSYFMATPVFGYQHNGPTQEPWYSMIEPHTQDGYKFYMDLGPLSNASKYYGEDNFFWQQLAEHPNYDEFWQRRSLLPHLEGIDHAVMTVGGWFDAEDLYGPLNIYQKIEKNNPEAFNVIVMGPWSHGDWARTRGTQKVGNIVFGENLSDFYQREIEAPFFKHFLKGEGEGPQFEALMFNTGTKAWQAFQQWPPAEAKTGQFFLRSKERLSLSPPEQQEPKNTEYISDPNEPVPYSEDIKIVFTPRKYMTDDQRFAERRPDVIEFQTEILERDLTLSGDLLARLFVSTTGTDADWVVKLIDVYPDDEPNAPETPEHIRLGGYQMMVRSEVIRGRFRNSYEKPEPFVPGEVAEVNLPLQDVYHTFKQGHRVMIQIQSTWFPLIDRNPQTYVENIFRATDLDFVKATHRVYHSMKHPSRIEFKYLH
jgi:putative CocE/NonD family hydrolase